MTSAIGILADPQFGDIPDAVSPDTASGEDRVQRFRMALQNTRDALAHMRQCRCVLNLGDTIQSGRTQSTAEIEADFDRICRVFEEEADQQVLHALGNHCIGRLEREEVCDRLGIPLRPTPPVPSVFPLSFPSCCRAPTPSTSYYACDISDAWTVIVLDTTEMSGHSGYPADSRPAREAAAYLARHPVDREPHMIPWNGGCTRQQLHWLTLQLEHAVKRGRLVVIASHHPIHPSSARPTHLAWNHQEILAITSTCPSVRLVLSGHDHMGGACRQSCVGSRVSQIYLTVPAILEAAVGTTEYLVLDLDELERRTACVDGDSSGTVHGDLVLAGGVKSRRIFKEVEAYVQMA